MSKGEATRRPEERLSDHCALCGHALSVVTRTWESMTGKWGRVITANYCNTRDSLCEEDNCKKECARKVPFNKWTNKLNKVERTIVRRQFQLAQQAV